MCFFKKRINLQVSQMNTSINNNLYYNYQKAVTETSRKYYDLMEQIEVKWSVIYNLNDFNSTISSDLEKLCLLDIEYYKKYKSINQMYNQITPSSVPAYKRLAMLYEKQNKYEKAISVCKEACLIGVKEQTRLSRMIKKAGRKPTNEEIKILNMNL